MIVQKKKWILASLAIAAAVAAILYINQNSDAANVIVSSKHQHHDQAKSTATDVTEDKICTILLMPKSYLPLLEKFKHSRFAREMEIVPAKIEWNNNQMFALPKKAVLKPGGRRMKDVNAAFNRKPNSTVKLTGEEKKQLRGTMALLFLKTIADIMSNYKFQEEFKNGGNYKEF